MKKFKVFILFIKLSAMFLCISATLFFVNSEKKKNKELVLTYNYLNERIEAEKERQQELMLEMEITLTDTYIERVARERLGLVKPNEIIFHNIGE